MPIYVVDNDGDYVVDNFEDDVVVLVEEEAPAGNPIRAMERTMAAMVALMLAQVQGERLTFQHVDDDPIALYMLPYGGRTAYGEYQSLKADTRTMKFDIPVQDGFDGSYGSVLNGDGIIFDGQVFRVTEVDPDALRAVYSITGTAKAARVR